MVHLQRPQSGKGQGLLEYAMILIIVAVVVIMILHAIGPTISQALYVLPDQAAITVFAKQAKVDPSKVQIINELGGKNAQYSFYLNVDGRVAIGWCTSSSTDDIKCTLAFAATPAPQ